MKRIAYLLYATAKGRWGEGKGSLGDMTVKWNESAIFIGIP